MSFLATIYLLVCIYEVSLIGNASLTEVSFPSVSLLQGVLLMCFCECGNCCLWGYKA